VAFGPLDSRYVGIGRGAGGTAPDYDPALTVTGTASANLITNGSFEDCGVACPASWAVFASIPGWTTVPGDNGIRANVNGLDLLPAPDGVAPADWTLFSYTFLHGGGNLVVTFAAFGLDNSVGGLIDSVSLRSVPEPGALLLLGAALIGVATRVRGRRA
jgi:hypothetical protein